MAVAYQRGGLPTKDGGAYFLPPEGNPSGLTSSLESRAQSVTNVFANVWHQHPFNNGITPNPPAKNFATVSPSASDLTYIPTKIYVGFGGNMTVTMRDGTSTTISNIPSGTFLDISPLKITSATASGIIAWW